MGLDMYIEYHHKNQPNDSTELKYYRKHHDLHGWMHRLYNEKHSNDKVFDVDFNCTRLYLNKDDLLRLKDDIKSYKLPETKGFLFGNNPPDDESNKEDLEMVKNALEILEDDNYLVYYTSWW